MMIIVLSCLLAFFLLSSICFFATIQKMKKDEKKAAEAYLNNLNEIHLKVDTLIEIYEKKLIIAQYHQQKKAMVDIQNRNFRVFHLN
jgi:ABC-type transport system involved in cytochrome bd biosynthesis fused ATPase/permease subunit